MARERMTGVDTAWLRMDSPGNLMMINAVEIFDTPISHDALAERLRERLLKFERFRQKVVADATGHWWVDDADFDLANHLVRARLPGAAGDAELKELVGELASEPLDPDRPLWEFRLVENYKDTNACVVRIHHCIADGIALVNVTMSMADDWKDPAAASGSAAAARRKAGHAEHDDEPRHEGSHVWDAFIDPLTRTAIKAAEVTGGALGSSLEVAGDRPGLAAVASVGTQVAKDALKIALMLEDSRTGLKGTPRGRKVVAWNEPLPLWEVKAVCKVLDVSVNDVLLSCVSGALHRYLEGCGEDTTGKEIRAMVPMNLRSPDAPPSLGNQFGLVPLVLPVGIANPVERLYEVRRRMDELKGGYQGMLAFAILGAMGFTPRPVQKLLLDYLANKGTAVMTNVPGPTEAIGIAGVKLRRLIPWVPQSGNIGVGISIYSYNGGVQFGMITDAEICRDPQKIIDGFEPEFERLLLTLCMLPRELVSAGHLDGREIERRLLRGTGRKAHGAPDRARRATPEKRAIPRRRAASPAKASKAAG